jgi:RNA polymerase sigma-70 factor (ECF subfamily)
MFALYRPRLWRMVRFRLHPRLQGRVDADDVLQEAWLKAADRVEYFRRDATRSPFVWFRMIVTQTLIELHRRHVRAEKRSTAREVSIDSGFTGDETSSAMAFHLSGHLTSPSHAAMRAEMAKQLDVALEGLSDVDREVLALRHFEELSNRETALVLNMTEQAASARYVRALVRLQAVLQALPGLTDNPPARR